MSQTQTSTKQPHLNQYLNTLLPRIYRFFSEQTYWWHIIIVLSFLCILLLGIQIERSFHSIQQAQVQRQEIQAQIEKILPLLTTYPGDRDLYLRLATYEYQLGNWNKAKEYLTKALELDPNFLPSRKLQAELLGE